MGRQNRSSEIRRRRQRAEKLTLLRRRFAAARTEAERSRLRKKVSRVAPFLPPEDLLRQPARGG